MKTFEYDLRYLKEGIEELESYLLSEQLFWPLEARTEPGEAAYPNLTLGNLLLVEARLKARPMTLAQQAQLGALLPQLEQVRSRWRSAWSKKALHSLHNRLKMWRDFLDEYTKAPEAHADRYPYEVQRRVMLALLAGEAEQAPPEVNDLIGKLDALLRAVLMKGDFIWEPELQAGFPEETYWYLYGRLPETLEHRP